MPVGCFLIEIDSKSKAKIIQTYYENPDESIELDGNLILELRMGLSEKRLFTLLKSDFSIVSYLADFRREKEHMNLITGVVLSRVSGDDPNNFLESIKMVSDIMIKSLSTNDKISLENIFQEYFETPSIVLNQKELENRLKNRVKKLNQSGKFDEAKKLLDKIKKIPKKLFKANKSGEMALKEKNFERAEFEFKKAYKFAQQLKEEKDLANTLLNKAKLVKQIPKLLEKRDKILDEAKKSLRIDRLDLAYKFFMEAGEISKKLLDPRGAEEYKLKAEALQKYNEIHKKFHKS
jgi:tetratricopeptide (TPR) repeat protein